MSVPMLVFIRHNNRKVLVEENSSAAKIRSVMEIRMNVKLANIATNMHSMSQVIPT